MKTALILLLLCCISLVLPQQQAEAVLGIPDPVPGASLLVPMFEVGIDSVANPHDTLPVVTNLCGATIGVCLNIWDIEGNHVTAACAGIAAADTVPLSMRNLINLAPSIQAQLTDGDFYHGYATFDSVTSAPMGTPAQPGYPFSDANCLIGQIYYTRLTQGSSNGMNMVSLEASSTTDSFLQGFYTGDDTREEIDSDARWCAEQMTRGNVCSGSTRTDGVLFAIVSRVLLDPGLSASTKLVVFAKPQGGNDPNDRAGNVNAVLVDETGAVVGAGPVNLSHVVNISTVAGIKNGSLALFNIPNGFEVFAFTINSANPTTGTGLDPLLTWDALFESFIVP